MYPNTQLYIEGKWRPAAGEAILPVVNPASGKQIGTVARASKADLDQALEAVRGEDRHLFSGQLCHVALLLVRGETLSRQTNEGCRGWFPRLRSQALMDQRVGPSG